MNDVQFAHFVFLLTFALSVYGFAGSKFYISVGLISKIYWGANWGIGRIGF